MGIIGLERFKQDRDAMQFAVSGLMSRVNRLKGS